MLAHARIKLKNAESSIAFVQEQHAKTLKGLHHEIQKLQQKNARQFQKSVLYLPRYHTHRSLSLGLTLELAMKESAAVSSS